MQTICGVVGCLLVIWIFSAGIHQRHHDEAAQRVRQSEQAEKYVAEQSRIEKYYGADRPRQAAKRSAVRSVPAATSAPTDAEQLIEQVARHYDVPAGALYGIWMKESGGLEFGWGTGKGWVNPLQMSQVGSKCRKNYSVEWCVRQERALRAICDQRRDGRSICDPSAIRTSWALAMGPMQHLPTELVKVKDGRYVFAQHAVDYDHDGVVDPHSLPDAMASAAILVKSNYRNNGGNWQKAINAYFGIQTAGYYEGTISGDKGVADYWREWCAMPGHCQEKAIVVAQAN